MKTYRSLVFITALAALLPCSRLAEIPSLPSPESLPEASDAVERCTAFAREGRPEEAISCLRTRMSESQAAPAPEVLLAIAATAILHDEPQDNVDSLLLNVVLDAPDLAPHASCLLARRRLARGNPEGALEALDTYEASGAPPGLHRERDLLRGQSLILLHRPEEAVPVFRSLLGSRPSRDQREEALWYLAQAQKTAGDARGARKSLRNLLRAFPEGVYSKPGQDLLDTLPGTKKAPAGKRGKRPSLDRVRRLLDRGRPGEALAMAEELIAQNRRKAARESLFYWKLRCLYALRRNADAAILAREMARSFGPTKTTLDAVLKGAWCRLRVNDEKGVRDFTAWVKKRKPSSHPASIRADFLLALSAYVNGRFEEADRLFQAVVDRGSGGGLYLGSLYRSIWCRYCLGDREGALDRLRRYRRIVPPGTMGTGTAYWMGRLLRETGDPHSARAWFERARDGDLLDYWQLRADALIEEDPLYSLTPPTGSDISFPRPWSGLRDPRSRLARKLSACGLENDAAWVFERVYASDAKDPAKAVTMAVLLSRAGRTGAAYAILKRLLPGNRGAVLKEGNDPALRALYPMLHMPEILPHAAREGVDPLLALAVMRQESSFRPHIVSPAGAVGLMQLMPSTARNLARDRGSDAFDADTLYDPGVNIELGVAYLGILKRFLGIRPVMAAAYNAGEDKAELWRKSFPDGDEELFIAMIPYDETRDYVARVMGNHIMYRRLYPPREAVPAQAPASLP